MHVFKLVPKIKSNLDYGCIMLQHWMCYIFLIGTTKYVTRVLCLC